MVTVFKKSNFESRTNKILAVFTDTVDELDKMNVEIKEDNRAREEQIKALQDTIRDNSRVYYKNEVIKDNINKILND
jgi:uncharacterized protein (UPF0305 family)